MSKGVNNLRATIKARLRVRLTCDLKGLSLAAPVPFNFHLDPDENVQVHQGALTSRKPEDVRSSHFFSTVETLLVHKRYLTFPREGQAHDWNSQDYQLPPATQRFHGLTWESLSHCSGKTPSAVETRSAPLMRAACVRAARTSARRDS